MYHITPINDIEPHIEKSYCGCEPEIIIVDGETLCVHNAYDFRELDEDLDKSGLEKQLKRAERTQNFEVAIKIKERII